MLRLKEPVRDFIHDTVNQPAELIRDIEKYANSPRFDRPVDWLIPNYRTKCKVELQLKLNKGNFDDLLEPNEWHARDKFDGNPCSYWIVENDGIITRLFDKEEKLHRLGALTKTFLYIVPPATAQNEQGD